jgi:hypothetical protein
MQMIRVLVSLITQRSQVQILPPLQSKTAGQRPFSESSGGGLCLRCEADVRKVSASAYADVAGKRPTAGEMV